MHALIGICSLPFFFFIFFADHTNFDLPFIFFGLSPIDIFNIIEPDIYFVYIKFILLHCWICGMNVTSTYSLCVSFMISISLLLKRTLPSFTRSLINVKFNCVYQQLCQIILSSLNVGPYKVLHNFLVDTFDLAEGH